MPNRGRRRTSEPFIMLSRRLLFGDETWKAISPGAKILYCYLKGKYNGSNNGEISLHYSELKGVKGISSPAAISRAIKELEAGGWIRRTRQGGLYRYSNKFELTGQHDDLIL